MIRTLLLSATLALALPAAQSVAQTVATGAGRDGELTEASRIDAYLADAGSAPSTRAESRVSAGEAAASTRALPPMAPDSPWSRGLAGPLGGPASLAEARAPQRACDHKVHGEVGAEIGTGGQRGGYGVATVPVGKDCWGQVTVGVSSYRGRGYGGYGGGYGGQLGLRGGDRTQNAFSLGFSAASDRGSRRDDETDRPPPAF